MHGHSMVTRLTDRIARMVSWPMHRMSIEDRRAAMDALMVVPSGAAIWRFAVLMFLSSLIAAIGLLQTSAAVVIGAMMIAPMMAPIMGIAACLIMGWGKRLLRGLLLVSVSAAGAVAVGWVFATLLAVAGTGLPNQVVERSSPDIRDLLVALGAGAAGAYATVHKKISGALPGVAVAVAVVPPLAAVGVLLGYRQAQLARGAALLFVTNLVGIVLMAVVVFLLTGLVPKHRFDTHRHWIIGSVVMAGASALAITLILTPRFITISGRAHDLKVATQTVTNLLSADGRLSNITISGSTVRADIIGPTAPPPVQDVSAALSRALGNPVTVQLGWIPEQDPEHSKPGIKQLPLSELSPVVEKWLGKQSLTLQGLSYESGALVVSSAGPHPPTSSADLTALISARFNSAMPVSLAWTHVPETGGSDDAETALNTVRETAKAWVSARPNTAVLSVTGSANAITVTIIGHQKPDVRVLEADLRTALPQATIAIQWVPGDLLAVDTPTPTKTPGP